MLELYTRHKKQVVNVTLPIYSVRIRYDRKPFSGRKLMIREKVLISKSKMITLITSRNDQYS